MNDTCPEVESRFNEMMMKKSGQERLKIGFSMFNMARSQVAASITMYKPDADINDIRSGIFLRFYGDEFAPDERAKILAKITSP
jgi:hypothetical protein